MGVGITALRVAFPNRLTWFYSASFLMDAGKKIGFPCVREVRIRNVLQLQLSLPVRWKESSCQTTHDSL